MASSGWPRALRLLLGFLAAAAAAASSSSSSSSSSSAGQEGPSPPPSPPPPPPPPPRVCGEGCCRGPPPPPGGSAVAAFCERRGRAALLRGRCCLDAPAAAAAQEAVLGLDLSNCSLTRLCSSFQEARTAVIIDLAGNPLRDLPEEAFRGFTRLQTLALPLPLDCPGGSQGWEGVSVQGSSRRCQGQRNPCNGSAGLVWLCPEASCCSADGPGLSQCLCMSPFHGYKCLRQGSFPYFLFFGTLGTITAALSSLLWATQRRKA